MLRQLFQKRIGKYVEENKTRGSQDVIFLTPEDQHHKKIKEGNEWYRKKLEEHNPLVASAEALLKTIVVTYNSNGAPRSQADWSGRAVSPEQLKE